MSGKKYKSIPSKRSDRSSRFAKQLVIQIVREVEGGLSRTEACAKYSMAYSTLEGWMAQYGSEIYHATKRTSFSVNQRRSITRAIGEGRMTKDEAHLIHKVSKKTLSTWLCKAKQEESELVCFNPSDMAVKQINYPGIELQSELAEARLKIKALETMIDIAEEQFKIAIRKKSGAKQ